MISASARLLSTMIGFIVRTPTFEPDALHQRIRSLCQIDASVYVECRQYAAVESQIVCEAAFLNATSPATTTVSLGPLVSVRSISETVFSPSGTSM